MRVLQIGSDRSKRGILYPGSAGFERQKAYAKEFGSLDIIGFSRRSDGVRESSSEQLRVIPTNSSSPLLYGLDALRIAKTLPKPDVVSAQDPFETGLAAWFIARRSNVPLHVQVHTDLLSPEYARRSLVNRIRVSIAGFVLKRAARIRVVSARVQGSIARLDLGVPITALPIYVDLERFRTAIVDPHLAERFARFTSKLLVVARLEPEKNVALAIRSFAEAAPADTCLIIVGRGSEQRQLEELARELGMTERIFFEGEAPSVGYYPLADLVLVPSRYEGYGLAIVEALAAGKPVIATDVGVAREAGAIVTDEAHFAEALADWFEHGPRTAALKSYPYADLGGYVRAYCEDIRACTTTKKSL